MAVPNNPEKNNNSLSPNIPLSFIFAQTMPVFSLKEKRGWFFIIASCGNGMSWLGMTIINFSSLGLWEFTFWQCFSFVSSLKMYCSFSCREAPTTFLCCCCVWAFSNIGNAIWLDNSSSVEQQPPASFFPLGECVADRKREKDETAAEKRDRTDRKRML